MTKLTIKRLKSIERLKEIARLANLSDADASEFGDLNEAETWEALIRFHASMNSCDVALYEREEFKGDAPTPTR